MITIDKGVPLQTQRQKYPFAQMAIGDSFFVAGSTTRRLSAAVSYWDKHHGTKCTVRKVDGGVRVWRIA